MNKSACNHAEELKKLRRSEFEERHKNHLEKLKSLRECKSEERRNDFLSTLRYRNRKQDKTIRNAHYFFFPLEKLEDVKN